MLRRSAQKYKVGTHGNLLRCLKCFCCGGQSTPWVFQIVLSVGAPKSTCSQHTGSFVQPFKVSSGNLLQLRFTPSSCALRDNGRRHSTCSADSRTDNHTNQTPLHTPFRFTPLTLLIHSSNILKSHVHSFSLIGEGSRHTNCKKYHATLQEIPDNYRK